MSTSLLFVYGTLLTVAQHPMGAILRNHAKFRDHGFIQARLYIIDDPDAPGTNSYPGAVPSPRPADRVQGELYELDKPDYVLALFDDYEACSPRWPEPHEFLRRNVQVTCDQGGEVAAISYLYTWDVSSAEHVPSGVFAKVSTNTR